MRKRRFSACRSVAYKKRVQPIYYPSNAPPIFIRRQDPRRRKKTHVSFVPHFRFPTLPKLPVLLALILAALAVWWWSHRQEVHLAAPALLPTSASLELELPLAAPVTQGSLVHTVRKSDTFASITSLYGFDKALTGDLQQALNTLAAAEKTSFPLRIGQKIVFTLNLDGEVQALHTAISPERSLDLARDAAKQFVGSIQTLSTESREHVVVGAVETSFSKAAYSAGLSYAVVDELVDLFSDRVTFREDFRVGDRFTVIYDNHAFGGEMPLSTGTILAAAIEVKGKRFAAVRYVGSDGKARYFNELGEPLGGTFLRFPLAFSRISSYFSKARFHPILQKWRPHNGIDFAAPTGTPVRSVGDGRVVFAGRDGGNGIMVKLQHGNGFETVYLHLAKVEKGVVRGARIARGQIVGAVGATGLATGPHLHYGLFDHGKYVDPMHSKLPISEMLVKGQKISDKYLRKVVFTLDRYQILNLATFYK